MKTLIIAEHNNKELSHTTRSVVTAALQIDTEIHLLLAGYSIECSDDAAKIQGVAKVIVTDNPCYEHFLAENLAPLIAGMASDYTHIIAPATTFGKDFMPRVAAILDVSQVSDIIAVESADTFVRPIYAGNAIATIQSIDSPKIITVRPSSFDKAEDGGNAEIEHRDVENDNGLSFFISKEETKSERPELTAASIIISGGRGMGSAENFGLIEKVADHLNAAIGASRAAVDAGYISNDAQVGQTGKIVAPDLYIAVGISGAIQHIAGMKNSKTIVAINKDENAPIFDIADYGLVADLFDVLPELEGLLRDM